MSKLLDCIAWVISNTFFLILSGIVFAVVILALPVWILPWAIARDCEREKLLKEQAERGEG
jgi:Flp pilus assembly protein TadB